MKDRAHHHLVIVDEDAHCISVFRLMPDGSRVPYTMFALPDTSAEKRTYTILDLARVLGEDLLMDSPIVRKLYLAL